MRHLHSFIKSVLAEQVRMKMEISLPADLKKIAHEFHRAGHSLFLVGGSVRDAVMGKEPKDWDVATDATPDKVIKMFEGWRGHRLLTVGKSFGVVVIVTPEGNEYEIATFRQDIGTGRRPDSVEFTDIATDVMRRDLTINALFYDLETHEIVDYVGGLKDIRDNVVRTVGDPDRRFEEDRLRVLRAFRFAGRMGSKLDAATAESIRRNNSLMGVSPERIRDEFLKGILSAKSVVNFLNMLLEFDMFKQIFPGLKINNAFKDTKNVPVQLAMLLLSNDSVVLAAKLNVLKYSVEEVSQVTFLVDFAKANDSMPIVRMKKSYKQSRLNDESLIEFCDLVEQRQLATKFLSFQLSVSPSELMGKGFVGKQLGDEIARTEQMLWVNS